jgi:hypothetical protein
MTMQHTDAGELGETTNGEPRQLGEIRNYADLHRLLRERVESLNVSRIVLDDATGLQNGYCSKILSPRPSKRLGTLSMGLLLQALGVKLVAYEDEQALAKIRPMLTPREGKVSVRSVPWGRQGKQFVVSRRWVKRIARDGGRARARSLTPAQRSASARKAAKARWRKPRLVEINEPA